MVLNRLLIYFFIPVLTLKHIPSLEFQGEFIWLSLSPFLIYLGSMAFFLLLGRKGQIKKKTQGALIMSSGIGSISFVGFPIFELLYGEAGLSYGIILSLAGTFLVFNTLGVGTGLYFSGKSKDWLSFFRNLLTFPPLLAFLLAIGINFTGWQIPEQAQMVISQLAAPFSVLALLAIGMQMDFSFDRELWKYLFLSQLYKLILAPLFTWFLLFQLLEVDQLIASICVLGAGIGCMNAVSILAAEMGLHPKLSTTLPAISIPLSIPFLFLIHLLIS